MQCLFCDVTKTIYALGHNVNPKMKKNVNSLIYKLDRSNKIFSNCTRHVILSQIAISYCQLNTYRLKTFIHIIYFKHSSLETSPVSSYNLHLVFIPEFEGLF